MTIYTEQRDAEIKEGGVSFFVDIYINTDGSEINAIEGSLSIGNGAEVVSDEYRGFNLHSVAQ